MRSQFSPQNEGAMIRKNKEQKEKKKAEITANNSMSNPLTPLQWLNIKLPQAKQTKEKKKSSKFPQGFCLCSKVWTRG